MQCLKFNSNFFRTLLISGVLGFVSQAHAAGYCSGGTATEGIGVGNVTFNSISAADCYGVVSGNITGSGTFAGGPVLNAMNWGSGWTYLDATNEAGSTFMGLSFTVAAAAGSSGSWTLTGTDTNGGAPLSFPASMDFAVGLKGGNEYALWGFNSVVVDGSDSGTFNIVFKNGGGQNPALSHLIVFGREATMPIPEPETWALMLLGLGATGFFARRRRIS